METLKEVFKKIAEDEKDWLQNPTANEKTKLSGRLHYRCEFEVAENKVDSS